jgi:hypothetical protein
MQIRIFRSAAEIEELRQAWTEKQCHPNSDIDHFLTVCATLDGVICPWVMSIASQNQIMGLVVARLERRPVRPRIGYTVLPGISAKSLSVIQGGFIGDFTDATASAGISALLAQMRSSEFDYLTIHKLPARHETIWNAIQEAGRGKIDVDHLRWTPHRRLSLAGQKTGFLLDQMSSKHRYNLRRQDKKFIETFPDQIEWQWHTHLQDLDALCKRMEEVASKTYQRGLGAGFFNDEIHRRRLSEFARRDLIRIMLLTVNGQPKAYWLGTAYNGVFHSTSLGYTPEITDFGVGNLMLFKLVDRLVADGFTALDFGSGDAEYKDRFSDQSMDEADATLYSGRFRSRCIQDYIAAVGRVDKTARAIVARMGTLNRLKRKWRDRLAAKAALKS